MCLLGVLFFKIAHAQKTDEELLNKLKSEANHQILRLKSFKEDQKKNQVYNNEREKGLAVFLEEQERWDVTREKGLADYKKQKVKTQIDEQGPLFKQNEANEKKYRDKYESQREVYVEARNKVLSNNDKFMTELEKEELSLLNLRPRFDLRKRGHNKWSKSASNAKSSGGGSSFDSGSSYSPPPPDYSAPTYDNYEEIPPPPPPPAFDGGYDPSFGSGEMQMPQPPPPPPPPDFDF